MDPLQWMGAVGMSPKQLYTNMLVDFDMRTTASFSMEEALLWTIDMYFDLKMV